MTALLVTTAAPSPAVAPTPDRVRRFAMLLESEDLTAIGARRPVVAVELDDHRHRVLSATVLVDARREGPTAVVIRTSRSGSVHGVVTWCSIDDGTTAQTAEPYEAGTMQSFHPLLEPYPVEAGTALTIAVDEAGRAAVTASTTRWPVAAPGRSGDRHDRQ